MQGIHWLDTTAFQVRRDLFNILIGLDIDDRQPFPIINRLAPIRIRIRGIFKIQHR